MRRIFLILALFLIFVIPLVSATTTTLDKESYSLTETATATFTCAGNEKNQAYTVVWSNASGFEIPLANDTGDTLDCTTFLESFTINSTYIDAYGSALNVTLTGTNLEGTDNATVSTASSSFRSHFVKGYVTGVQWRNQPHGQAASDVYMECVPSDQPNHS